MKERLAICLLGQPRMFKKSYESLRAHILDKFDCDIFIFTWDKKDSSPVGISESFRYEDEGTIEEYLDLYRPKAHNIIKFDDAMEKVFVDAEKKYAVHRADNYVRRYLAMLFGIWYVNTIKHNYGRDNKIQYQYVIRTRPDLEYQGFELPKKNLSIDSYGNGRRPDAPGDVFAIGRKNEMDFYCNLTNLLDKYVTQDKILLNTEYLLEHHLKDVDYEISSHVKQVLRPPNWNK